MIAIQPTLTINVDGVIFEVSKMSTEVQQQIQYLDEWRQREMDISSDLLMVRGALRNLQDNLLVTIQKERKAEADAAQAEADAKQSELVEVNDVV